MFLLKENPPGTSFNPSGSQSGNQGGVNFNIDDEKFDEKRKQRYTIPVF